MTLFQSSIRSLARQFAMFLHLYRLVFLIDARARGVVNPKRFRGVVIAFGVAFR